MLPSQTPQQLQQQQALQQREAPRQALRPASEQHPRRMRQYHHSPAVTKRTGGGMT
jgi:hypothetical protein